MNIGSMPKEGWHMFTILESTIFPLCRIVLCIVVGHALMAMAQSPGKFTATGNMMTQRAGHVATLLLNGKVLIVGGYKDIFLDDPPLHSPELYDPSTGAFTATGDMAGDYVVTATLLPDGRVLIIGVTTPFGAEIYDPSTGTFTATGKVAAKPYPSLRGSPLLQDGRVFVAGYPTAQLYDPVRGTFAPTGPYAAPAPGVMGSSTLLADGRVLLTGAVNICFSPLCRDPGTGWTELFDPKTGTFSLADSMKGWNNVYTATLLPSGKVLFVGNDTYNGISPSAEVFDPSTGTFTTIASPSASHQYGAATLLPEGTVLITGGLTPGGAAQVISELYIRENSIFSTADNMRTARLQHTSTLLSDGTVLIAGGMGFLTPSGTLGSAGNSILRTAEIYNPRSITSATVLLSLSGDGKGPGAILHAATQQVVSSTNPAVEGEALEIYGTGLIDGSVIPPQVAIGGRMAEVLFFGKAPGYAGLNQINVRVPNSVASGPAISTRLNYLGRPSNEVTVAIQ